MTCKDCLHYESHKHFFNSPNYKKDFDDYFKDKDIEHKCPEFTNHSEWVHLPCKVGDKVWYITGIGNKLIKPAIVKEIIIDSKGIKDLYVCGNGYNFERSFDIFYLTYKEAEKHLEDE